MELRLNSIRLFVVTVATLIASFFVDQYDRTGTDLLVGEWKVRKSEKAAVFINEKEIHLLSFTPNDYANVSQEISLYQNLLQLSVDSLFIDVMSGDKKGHMERLILAQHDGGRYIRTHPHLVVQADGTKDWTTIPHF